MRKIKIGNGFAGIAVEIICGLVVLLFLYTAVSKFMDFKTYKEDMYSQPFPHDVATFFIWAVPLFEVVIAAAIFSPVIVKNERIRKRGLYASLILMSLFTLYTGVVLAKVFGHIPCSCGGVIKGLTWTQHMFFNLFFVVIISLAIRLWKRMSINPIGEQSKHSLYGTTI
jgi:hypothetical protein